MLTELGFDSETSNVDIVIADASDPASMLSMAKSAEVVLACAGPYGRYGEGAILACINGGAHYVDITGESPWVSKMINKHSEASKRAGVSLVSFAGYDCIPAELALMLCTLDLGASNISKLDMVVTSSGGGFPKGTLYTIMDGIEGKGRFPREHGDKPFISREYKQVQKRALAAWQWLLPIWIPHAGQFTSMNFMAPVNMPVLCRVADAMETSNSLRIRDRLSLAGKWGSSVLTLWGLFPYLMYQTVGLFVVILLMSPPFRWWLKRRLNTYNFGGNEHGRVHMRACGTSIDEKSSVDVKIACNGDPGIYCTGRFAASVAWALVDVVDSNSSDKIRSGFNSPCVAFQGALNVLLKRLKDGGVDIKISSSKKSSR